MKFLRICFPVIFLFFFFSCKKFVENQKEKAAMSFITDGHWEIASYLVDSTSITDQFGGYKFKFNDDGTVDGVNGSQAEKGTWLGNVNDYSITSEFPSGPPLNKLNGKWTIKDSGLTYVKADLPTDSATMHLHLIKVP
ncbi:MAG: hypothetical protein JNK79_15300 [Chitinophagaceae bacterium]|nr:hypothetical protein [Chitinophagaceae bacterium]